ncbi:MAG: ComEC family competence protein, partial [Sphingopyxis sp.]|nr:ComEC family competence protein [Sphingopyxis sp.]
MHKAQSWPRNVAVLLTDRLAAERDTLVCWIPVMLGAGIAMWFLLPGSVSWAGFLALCAGGAVTAWMMGAREYLLPRCLFAACLLMAVGCALIWWRAERVAAPLLERPAMVTMVAAVEAVERLPARDTVRLRLAPRAADGLPPRIRVSLADTDPAAQRVQPGDWVRLRARLMPPPRAALPGGYDFSRRAWFDGIGAVGRAIGPMEIVATGPARGATLDRLRARLSAHIQTRMDGGAGAIGAALVTGDRGAISEEDNEAMRRAGLSHLLSISGLHITAAVGGTMWLALRILALFPWLVLRVRLHLVAAGIAALVGLGYTLLTGSEIPTIRSLAAALLIVVALWIGREAMTLRLVATGAAIILLIWPESLVGPSFQLSFAAVTAIVALHSHPWVAARLARRDEAWPARAARNVAGLLLTGIAVELVIMPIALFHFHKAGLYGALANVVVIPLTTLVIMPFEALALLLDVAGLGAPAWWVAEQALNLMLWIAHAVATAPGAVAAFPAMATGAFALCVVGGLWLLLWQGRMRWAGALPLGIGVIWALATPVPDILITADGRHVSVRGDDGRLLLLRERSGDFVRDQLAEAAGVDGTLGALSMARGADCSPDFCVWQMVRGERRWTIMAARSSIRTDWQAL